MSRPSTSSSGFAFDVLISDLRLPGIDGREVLDAALRRYPGIIGIVVTGYGTVKDAVDAIKRGAADFVSKPFQFEELLHVLESALEQRRLRSENAYLRQQLEQRDGLPGVVGRSRPMRDLCQMIETVAPSARDGAHHRRDRHRQGSDRARHPPDQPAPRSIGSSRSTAARSPRRCSRPSSSAMRAARSPAPSPRARAASNRPTAARSSSTKSAR